LQHNRSAEGRTLTAFFFAGFQKKLPRHFQKREAFFDYE
jgi:hypothetical protein